MQAVLLLYYNYHTIKLDAILIYASDPAICRSVYRVDTYDWAEPDRAPPPHTHTHKLNIATPSAYVYILL